MSWWYISFVDPTKPEGQRFSGVCWVQARTALEALHAAAALGCNPGGCAGTTRVPGDAGAPPVGSENTLHTSKVEIELLSKAWFGEDGGTCKTLDEHQKERQS